MDAYPTAQYDDDENFFYIPNSIYENMAFFFEAPYSFELDNKLEEITINDSSLLIICRNSNVGNVSDVLLKIQQLTNQ